MSSSSPSPLTIADLAYIAGMIDTVALVSTRPYRDHRLPSVSVHMPVSPSLTYLAETTGVRLTIIRRDYVKAGCSQHCPEQHQHVYSVSGRWQVTGSRATIVLAAVRPYLKVQGAVADTTIELGLRVGRKPAIAEKMAGLGWPVPSGWVPPSPGLALVR